MRCEGWRRYGGAFSIGLPEWRQCDNDGIALIKTTNNDKPLPCCNICWNEIKKNEIIIESVEPIPEATDDKY